MIYIYIWVGAERKISIIIGMLLLLYSYLPTQKGILVINYSYKRKGQWSLTRYRKTKFHLETPIESLKLEYSYLYLGYKQVLKDQLRK